jgi:serine/threonine protein kinase
MTLAPFLTVPWGRDPPLLVETQNAATPALSPCWTFRLLTLAHPNERDVTDTGFSAGSEGSKRKDRSVAYSAYMATPWSSTAMPLDPRKRVDPRTPQAPSPNNDADDEFQVIDEVEWADDKDSGGELALRPKGDRNFDPCGCKADASQEPCCNDMSCVLFACQEECRNNCEAGHLCRNKRLTHKEWKQVQVFDAGVKGKGLRMLQPAKKGDLITEYVGRAIRKGYLDRLFQRYRNERMLYIMALDKDTYIDARKKGGIARYINHSCEPNCIVERWKVRGGLRAGIYALRDIDAGEELSFDYKWDRKRGRAPTKCHCFSPTCRGTLEVAKSMEEGELERQLKGHWNKPTSSKAGREIINRSVKILLEEHHEYFSADVCKFDDTTGKHLVIYRHDLEEVWEDLSSEEWMILDEEAEQFVIGKKSQPSAASSSLLGAGLASDTTGEPMRRQNNYMFVQTPVKEQFIGRHLIERCQRNCHVTIDIQCAKATFETPLPDDELALEQQRALEASKDDMVWKLTISGFNISKAYSILEKNVEFIEKSLQATETASGAAAPTGDYVHAELHEVIIPRCVVEQVKRRLPEIRDKCRSVNITFAHSESKSKQFSRLILEATLASDLEVAKHHVWTKLVTICCEENAPTAPSGIHKDLGFLGGELRSDLFRLLLSEKDKARLTQECTEDLHPSPFFSSFESTQRCTVWVQSLEDKGRIDGNNRIINEGSPNAPRKMYFGCAPKDVPNLWNLVQSRASELSRGVRYLYLGADRMYQQFMMRNGGQFLDYIRTITGVSVTVDSMTGNHLRLDGRTEEALVLENLPQSESSRVAIAEDLIRLQIELYRDHCIRHQNWIFGRDWTSMNPPGSSAPSDPSLPWKTPNTARPSTPSSRQSEARTIANACMETAEIVSTLELGGSVAAHAVIIMYRFLTVISAQETHNCHIKTRELLLGCIFLANKAQKVTKWKRIDALLEAAYKTFYPAAAFSRDNEEVTIMEKRILSAEAEILAALEYDIFWRGADWIVAVAIEAGKVAEPMAKNAFELCLSGPVLAAGPTLWLKYGAEYVFAAVAGFLHIDLENLVTALSLIPLKVSQAADIIARSVKASSVGRKGATHTFFTGGNETLLEQVSLIHEACITYMSKGIIPGASVPTATSESVKMHEIIGRRANRQRIFRGVASSLVRKRIMPVIDGLCAESNCKIFVGESASGGSEDIILQGSWRALAIAEHLLLSVCEGMLPPAGDGYADQVSTSAQAKFDPGLMSTSAVYTTDGWKGTIQSKILDEATSWGSKVGGKCCVAGTITEDSVCLSGLRWWVPPRYGRSPSGSLCDTFAIRDNKADPNRQRSDLEALASLACDLMGYVQSSELFPSLMPFSKSLHNAASGTDDRHMAVSLQRWPPEKVSNRETRGNKGCLLGVSPAALQEMELLNQLHSLIPSPQGHPNFILPIAVALPPEEAESRESPEKSPSSSYSTRKGSDNDIFSLFRTSEENENVAQKEKKKRNDLVSGAHLIFDPTPFIFQRFTSRSKRSSGDGTAKNDQALTLPLSTAWFHDLLSALLHCHENHVVLRTLQPDQIVVDHSGVAKLGGLFRATVLPDGDRKKSPNPLKSAKAKARRDNNEDGDDASNVYIAPEILLGSTKHTKEADIWSMGCLFAHLLLTKSLFVGKDKASLLLSIFKVVGTPSKHNYRDAAKFPLFTEPPKKYKRGVQRALRHLMGDEEAKKNALALDLVERMLHLDPTKRITAGDALKHECMAAFIESCSSDSFRRQYVNDWLALKQKFMQASKAADDHAHRQESTMKRKALLMTASAADQDDDVHDGLYDMDDLLGEMGEKKQKL